MYTTIKLADMPHGAFAPNNVRAKIFSLKSVTGKIDQVQTVSIGDRNDRRKDYNVEAWNARLDDIGTNDFANTFGCFDKETEEIEVVVNYRSGLVYAKITPMSDRVAHFVYPKGYTSAQNVKFHQKSRAHNFHDYRVLCEGAVTEIIDENTIEFHAPYSRFRSSFFGRGFPEDEHFNVHRFTIPGEIPEGPKEKEMWGANCCIHTQNRVPLTELVSIGTYINIFGIHTGEDFVDIRGMSVSGNQNAWTFHGIPIGKIEYKMKD
tara:strand:+ start:3744 stop:4532 length:789 start_codon:yes stop_codon:yes gene_type:complete